MSGDLTENRGPATADRGLRRCRIWGLGAGQDRAPVRLFGIFSASRLNIYGYLLAAIFVMYCICEAGSWLLDASGRPRLIDFSTCWIVGDQARHGNVSALYNAKEFISIQKRSFVSNAPYYPNWPYPPYVPILFIPFSLLPYMAAFIVWEASTLLGYVGVVFLIVRRWSAIAVVLAAPFWVFNIREGQTGFFYASLLGGALLTLERCPVLAGVLIGCLTYKPQFGILIPLALVAGRQWRALGSAVVTTASLVAVSILAFGIHPWEALPRELSGQASDMLLGSAPLGAEWAWFQTVCGMVRTLDDSAVLGWICQGAAAAAAALIVWRVWRSPARYDLKAAALSAAILIATPYAWPHDLVVIAIPVAFLAKDQTRCGLLRGEQATLIALFGLALALFLYGEALPLGPLITISLLGVVLRRVYFARFIIAARGIVPSPASPPVARGVGD